MDLHKKKSGSATPYLYIKFSCIAKTWVIKEVRMLKKRLFSSDIMNQGNCNGNYKGNAKYHWFKNYGVLPTNYLKWG